MSKRIWTESRQIEALDSTQNKRGNWGQSGEIQPGQLEGNQGQLVGNQGQLGVNRMQLGSIKGKRESIGGNLDQLWAIGSNQG